MRIERHITIGTSHPLTVVTGPPGAGKTTAAASWAAGARGPVAWVTLDRYDGRPSVFWSAIVEALRRAGVAFRRVPTERGAAAGHLSLLRLASDLAAQYPPVTLILDDFHLVASAALTDGLQYLFQQGKTKVLS